MHPLGFEPRLADPKSAVISISLRVRLERSLSAPGSIDYNRPLSAARTQKMPLAAKSASLNDGVSPDRLNISENFKSIRAGPPAFSIFCMIDPALTGPIKLTAEKASGGTPHEAGEVL
jgi:hypothetical protein